MASIFEVERTLFGIFFEVARAQLQNAFHPTYGFYAAKCLRAYCYRHGCVRKTQIWIAASWSSKMRVILF